MSFIALIILSNKELIINMVENTLNDFANLLSFDNPPGASRRKASDDFDVKD